MDQPKSNSTLQPKDYKSELKPIWCPGCGDFGVVQGIYRALANIGRPPHEIAFISGIGCSSRIPGYSTAYGFNTVHGRSLPIAQGVKLANPELLVIVAGGDGDGFSIGGGHVAHAIRRNVDLAYLVMDNQVYGLTKGQLSPTSPRGLKTITSPFGSLEEPINPLLYVLAYGAGFVAQATPADMPGMAAVIEEAIRFPGFAFVNIQSPCVTFGEDDQQLRVHKSKMKPLAGMGHDPTNLMKAMDLARAYGTELYTGVFYRDPNPRPTYDALIKIRQTELARTARPRERVLDAFLQNGKRGIDYANLSLRDALDLGGLMKEDARDRYQDLADELATHHTQAASAFYQRMAHIEEVERSQLADRRRLDFGESPATVTPAMLAEGLQAPEFDEARAFMSVRQALESALESEVRAEAFFVNALAKVRDEKVRELFEKLRAQEAEHQRMVKAELARTPNDPGKPEDYSDDPVAQ